MKLGDFKSAAERIAAALVRAQKLGFELPPSIYGFEQCQIRLQNTIESFNNEIIEIQRIMGILNEAKEATLVGVKSDFEDQLAMDGFSAANMKMALISDKEEDLRMLIHDSSKPHRKILEHFFYDSFQNLSNIANGRDSVFATTFFSGLGNINQCYNVNGSKFFTRDKWDAVLTKYGFNMAEDGRTEQQQKTDFMTHMGTLDDDNTYAMVADFKALLKPYDVMGALENLWIAQDKKKGPEEIRRLEDVVISRIQNAKRALLEMSRKKIDDDNNRPIEDFQNDPEKQQLLQNNPEQYNLELAQAQQVKADFMAPKLKWTNLDQILNPVKERLANPQPETLTQLKGELGPFFKNPIFGRRLEDAFNAYENAVNTHADNQQQLLDALLEAYRMPLIMTFGKSVDSANVLHVNNNEPNNFVKVMSDVINVRWKPALKSAGLYKSIKYGIRIEGDLQNRNLSTGESIKYVWNLISPFKRD